MMEYSNQSQDNEVDIARNPTTGSKKRRRSRRIRGKAPKDNKNEHSKVLKLTEEPKTNAIDCPICLKQITTETIGIPENCKHEFCFVCLLEWSKNSNKCPLDRTKYYKIFFRGPTHPTIEGHIVVPGNVGLSSSYGLSCFVCNTEQSEELKPCLVCSRAFHYRCEYTHLRWYSRGAAWLCKECRQNLALPNDGLSALRDSSLDSADEEPTEPFPGFVVSEEERQHFLQTLRIQRRHIDYYNDFPAANDVISDPEVTEDDESADEMAERTPEGSDEDVYSHYGGSEDDVAFSPRGGTEEVVDSSPRARDSSEEDIEYSPRSPDGSEEDVDFSPPPRGVFEDVVLAIPRARQETEEVIPFSPRSPSPEKARGIRVAVVPRYVEAGASNHDSFSPQSPNEVFLCVGAPLPRIIPTSPRPGVSYNVFSHLSNVSSDGEEESGVVEVVQHSGNVSGPEDIQYCEEVSQNDNP